MKPGEHKTVQARILKYAQDVGWSFVSRPVAEERRAGFPYLRATHRQATRQSGQDAGKNARASLSLFFDDLLDAKVREFNPRYGETKGELVSRFSHFQTNVYGNREFVDYLSNRGKFFDQEENRERDLVLIDFDDPGNIKPSIQGGFRKKGLRIFPAYVHLKAKNHHCLINHLSLFLPAKGPCRHGNLE